MTCKEFLKILATNPDKRLNFVVAIPPNTLHSQYENSYIVGGMTLYENSEDTVTLYLDGHG